MLAIRMQRLGRKGHPTYRVVVQDVRQTPTSGKYVALLGSYDPHTKTSTLVKEKAEFYLTNGAQPSERVVSLFKAEGVTLPSWVKVETTTKASTTKNAEKLRKNQPVAVEAVAEAPEETEESPAAADVTETVEVETPAEVVEEAEVAVAEESEAPAEEVETEKA